MRFPSPHLLCSIIPLAFLAGPALAEDAPETILPMTVESGSIVPGKQDTRIFQVPVTVSGTKSSFIWSCGGQCIVSEHFCHLAHLEIRENEDLKPMTDAAGLPLFLGDTIADVVIGGKSNIVTAWVMRDTKYNKGMTGILGYDVASQYQWEVDPTKPSLTLRPPGTAPKGKPLATLPLRLDQQNFWVTIKIRNAEEEVSLMPQTPDLQASPDLQKKWDLESSGKVTDAQTYMGKVRSMTLKGLDGVWFNKDLFEGNVPVYLLSDGPNVRSGMGQSLLNRYVYMVDPEKKELTLLRRIAGPAAPPAKGEEPKK